MAGQHEGGRAQGRKPTVARCRSPVKYIKNVIIDYNMNYSLQQSYRNFWSPAAASMLPMLLAGSSDERGTKPTSAARAKKKELAVK